MSIPFTLDRGRARFARNLRDWRTLRGLSQQELALQAGLSRAYVSKVENSSASISIDTMEKLSDVLAIDIAELLAPAAIHPD